MKPYIIIGAIIVIVVLVIAGASGIFNSPYWETKSEFGTYQDELIIEYADGTTKSMKLINEESFGLASKYWYGSKEVTGAYIVLSATVSGSGYSGANIRCNNFGYTLTYTNQHGNKVYEAYTNTNDKEYLVMLDEGKIDLYTQSNTNRKFSWNLEDKGDGLYYIRWKANMGSVEYKPYPSSEDWQTATPPPDRTINIVKTTTPTGKIVVTLSSSGGAS